MRRHKFSIITITKNPNIEWFKETLISLQNQSYTDYEYIVLDASDDVVFSEIKNVISLSEIKSNIILKKQESIGIWPAFNEAYDLSSGEFLAVINSDDYYYDSNVLYKVHLELDSKNLDYCYGNSQRVDMNKGYLYLQKPLSFLKKSNYDFFVFNISHHSLFFRKEVLNNISFYPSKTNAVDLEFVRNLYKSNYVGAYLDLTVACFRIHDNNFSSTYSRLDTTKLFVEWNGLPEIFFTFSRLVVFVSNPRYFLFYLKRLVKGFLL